MEILLPLLVFIFGLIAGSFLNAALYRFNTGQGMGGRSHCTSCADVIKARDLIPVVSYLVLKGQCRACHSHISLSYPLVELSAGLLLLATYCVAPTLVIFLVHSLCWLVVLFIAVYDLRHLIIPFPFAEILAVLTFVTLFISEGFFTIPSYEALLAGPVTALPLFLIALFSRGRWMGFGDWKLMLGLGWLVGFENGIGALLFSFWIGALVSVSLLIVRFRRKGRRLTMRSEVPMAPFLVAGALLAYFTDATPFLKALFF